MTGVPTPTQFLQVGLNANDATGATMEVDQRYQTFFLPIYTNVSLQMAALFVNLSWSYAAVYIFDNNLTFLTFEIPADTRPKDGKSAILTKVRRAEAGQHRMTSIISWVASSEGAILN